MRRLHQHEDDAVYGSNWSYAEAHYPKPTCGAAAGWWWPPSRLIWLTSSTWPPRTKPV